MHVKYFATICSFIVLISVVELIRRNKMTFKYALTWLSASVLVITLSIFDGILYRISNWAGFTLPSNFIIFLIFLFTIFLSLLLTIYANEQNKRLEILAQKVGILENRITKTEPKDPL